MSLPKICLGAWARGNDDTFGNNLAEKALSPIFNAAMIKGFFFGILHMLMVWEIQKKF